MCYSLLNTEKGETQMKNKHLGFLTDIFTIILLLLMFVTTLYVSVNTNDLVQNLMFLCGLYVIMLLTYFTNVMTGLVLDIIVIFVGFTVMLYLSYTKGIEIPSYGYFWGIAYPIFTIVIAMLTSKSLECQKEVKRLEKEVSELVIIDPPTGLKNQKGFIHDTNIYMKLANRYQHDVSLAVVEIRYRQELQKLMSKEDMEKLIIYMSDIFKEMLRTEDQIYLLDRRKVQWGVLFISNDAQSMKSVISRLKEKMNALEIEDSAKLNQMNIDVRIGMATYKEAIKSPLDLLQKARAEMEYDVEG